jgi:hypothetical protein
MAEVLAHRAPSTAATYHKVLKVLYAWLLDEQEIDSDPMAKMKRPTVPAKPVRSCPPMGSSGCSPPAPARASRPAATPR